MPSEAYIREVFTLDQQKYEEAQKETIITSENFQQLLQILGNDENAVEFTPLTILAKKNEKMPMLYLGITEKTKEKYAGSIVTFLDMGVAEES